MDLVKEVKHAGKTVKVYYDPDPLNPRIDYDNITTIVHWHSRYDFGTRIEAGTTLEQLVANKAELEGDPIFAILPLYLYDHSGISISVVPFSSCSFDSGQVGWVFMTQSLSHRLGVEGWSKEECEEAIRDDVETYNSFLTGEVFGYQVIGEEEGEVLESCWGFIGDSEFCLAEGKLAAEGCEDPVVEKKVEELASRITYASVF